jgi:hypothetical protein
MVLKLRLDRVAQAQPTRLGSYEANAEQDMQKELEMLVCSDNR